MKNNNQITKDTFVLTQSPRLQASLAFNATPKLTHQRFTRRQALVAIFGTCSASSLLMLVGCATTPPPEAFIVTPELLAQRQLQSRRYDGITEESTLIASSNVLQDMGFNLENSEVKLGVLTANKQRDATNAGEIVGAVVLAVLFGVVAPVSKSQSIRVSLVIQPAGKESLIAPAYAGASATTPIEATKKIIKQMPKAQQQEIIDMARKPGNYVVRITFQRVVTRTDNSVYIETINDIEIYQEFFDKLSKSVFIEAQQI